MFKVLIAKGNVRLQKVYLLFVSDNSEQQNEKNDG